MLYLHVFELFDILYDIGSSRTIPIYSVDQRKQLCSAWFGTCAPRSLHTSTKSWMSEKMAENINSETSTDLDSETSTDVDDDKETFHTIIKDTERAKGSNLQLFLCRSHVLKDIP